MQRRYRRLVTKILSYSPWWIIIILIIFNIFFTPRFFTWLNIKNILTQSAVLGMVTIGESLCLLSGNLDLSVESTLALSAVIGGLLVNNGIPYYAAIVGMLFTGCAVGLINGLLVRKVGMNAFIATLITYLGMRGIAMGIVKGRTIYDLPQGLRFLGGTYVGGMSIQIFQVLFFFGLFTLLLTNTAWGRHVYVTGDNEVAAYTSGINTDRVVISAFVLSGLLSAYAGLLLAGRLNSAAPIFAEGMVFQTMAAAVIGGVSLFGGIGKLPIAYAGVLILAIIGNVLNMHEISPYWVKTIRAGMILVAVVIDATRRRLVTYE